MPPCPPDPRVASAILAEAKTDDLISEAPKPALDQSGEWQETSGEIQWVAAETNDSQTDKESEKKEEEDEELDLNKGRCLSACKRIMHRIVPEFKVKLMQPFAVLYNCLKMGNNWYY